MNRAVLFVVLFSSSCLSEDAGGGKVSICIATEFAPIVEPNANGDIVFDVRSLVEGGDIDSGIKTCEPPELAQHVFMMSDVFGRVRLSVSVEGREGDEMLGSDDLSPASGSVTMGLDHAGSVGLNLLDDSGVVLVAAQSVAGEVQGIPPVSRGKDVAQLGTDCGYIVESQIVVRHDGGDEFMRGGSAIGVSYGGTPYQFYAGSSVYTREWKCSDDYSYMSWFVKRS